MTETELIRATNRVKISTALTILRDILPDEEYMISKEELCEIMSPLRAIEERLFGSYECEEEKVRL